VTGDGIERRLAAILSANVVGYSRLMGEDDTVVPKLPARVRLSRMT